MNVDAANTRHHGRGFWVAAGIGAALSGWGVVLYLRATPDLHRRIGFAAWLVGLDLAHDALVAPFVVLIGLAVARLVPATIRAPVQAGAIASACVLLVAAAPLARTADGTRNPTIQPLDYRTATLTVLAVVWSACALWVLIRARRSVRRP